MQPHGARKAARVRCRDASCPSPESEEAFRAELAGPCPYPWERMTRPEERFFASERDELSMITWAPLAVTKLLQAQSVGRMRVYPYSKPSAAPLRGGCRRYRSRPAHPRGGSAGCRASHRLIVEDGVAMAEGTAARVLSGKPEWVPLLQSVASEYSAIDQSSGASP